jgi:hypothetical protein
MSLPLLVLLIAVLVAAVIVGMGFFLRHLDEPAHGSIPAFEQ